jgi:hypothetical protein
MCPICRQPIDPAAGPTHPNCLFTELDDVSDPAAAQLKNELIQIIKYADRQNPRSRQQALGPSEIGTPCDRRLAYRIAEIPAVNTDTDPWAAIVGTAIHSWLDEAIQLWCRDTPDCGWQTETPVVLSEFVKGRSDAFHNGTVIDHKGAGPDVMRKIRKHGPPEGYVIQVQLYGLGYEMLGFDVKKVALAFYPRAGWLKDMYVWTDEYRRDIANAAMGRLYDVSKSVIDLDVLNNPHRWEAINFHPGNECGFCPWYDPGRDAELGADDKGCPGR